MPIDFYFSPAVIKGPMPNFYNALLPQVKKLDTGTLPETIQQKGSMLRCRISTPEVRGDKWKLEVLEVFDSAAATKEVIKERPIHILEPIKQDVVFKILRRHAENLYSSLDRGLPKDINAVRREYAGSLVLTNEDPYSLPPQGVKIF